MIQGTLRRVKKRRQNLSLKALRKVIDRTQTTFAAMVGVSTDTVISWENGRNRLTPDKARLIHMATGARPAELVDGKGKVFNEDGAPYAVEDFKRWHETYLIAPDMTKAEYFYRQGSITLFLLFQAAAKPGSGKLKNRLPAVWGSFLQWAERASVDFKLKSQIGEVRNKHKARLRELSAKAHANVKGKLCKV